jgi:protease-4
MQRRDGILLAIMVVCVVLFAAAFLTSLGGLGGSDGLAGFGNKVGLVEIKGQIESSAEIVRQLRYYAKQGNVSAVVIRLDSPGGGVAASQEIFEEIGKLRDAGKVVVASMGSVAASGALYIACAVDTVVANPGTLTGSIGVIFQFPVFEGLMDKVGIRLETVRSGEFKDVGNPSRSITPHEEAMLQAVIDDTYEQFVDVVAEGRRLDRDSVLGLATGAIFTGQQALDLGLVDVLGNYQDAIDLAGFMTGLGDDPPTLRQSERRPFRWTDLLGSFLGHPTEFESGRGPRLSYLFKY